MEPNLMRKEIETRAASGCLLDNENIKTIREKSSALVVKKKEKKESRVIFPPESFSLNFHSQNHFNSVNYGNLNILVRSEEIFWRFYIFFKYAKQINWIKMTDVEVMHSVDIKKTKKTKKTKKEVNIEEIESEIQNDQK